MINPHAVRPQGGGRLRSIASDPNMYKQRLETSAIPSLPRATISTLLIYDTPSLLGSFSSLSSRMDDRRLQPAMY